MQSNAPDVDEYLQGLSAERREAIRVLRALILETVPAAEESMLYRMPTYQAAGDFLAALASQKAYLSLYLNTDVVAAHREQLGHLNCGKSCIRFKRLAQLPLEVIRTMLQETWEKNRQE